MPWLSIGKITVTTAGTPVRLTSTQSDATARYPCHALLVQQIPGNTGRLVLGVSGMNSSTYAGCLALLGVPTNTILPSANGGITHAPNAFNLADFYLDASVSGEGGLVSVLIS